MISLTLGGDQPVLLIVCLSQNAVYLEETLNSISYAEKAKKIKPVENRQPLNSAPEEVLKKRVIELEKENSNLRKLLLTRATTEQSPQDKLAAQKNHLSQTLERLSPRSNFDFSSLNYTTMDLARDLQTLITTAGELSDKRHELEDLRSDISDNDTMIGDLQQVIGQETDEQATVSLYREMKAVADKLEDNMQCRERAMLEEDALCEHMEKVVRDVKAGFEMSLMQVKNSACYVERISEFRVSPNFKKAGKEILELDQDFDVKTELLALKTELKRKEEQINELSKAMKHLARKPYQPPSAGLSRVGLEYMLADISSIRYDPKLFTFKSDYPLKEKKASITNHTETLMAQVISKLSNILDPTTKASEGDGLQHIISTGINQTSNQAIDTGTDMHARDSYIQMTRPRRNSHPSMSSRPDIIDHNPSLLRNSSAQLFDRYCHLEASYHGATSSLDDSNINPLSLVDNNMF